MSRRIFVNLPVKDLERTKAFFGALGFTFDPKFTNEKAACMIIGDNQFVMLLTEPFFKTFIKKDLCDARRTTEMLLALSCENRAEVDALVEKAVASGATMTRDPEDLGFMYSQSFEDLDGHIWEPFFMDEAAMEQAAAG